MNTWTQKIFICWYQILLFFNTVSKYSYIMFAFMFLLILLCISNFKIIFHFLLPSFLLSFFFGTVIMQNRSTILNHSAYLSTNFIYMYVIYCEFFNVLHFGYILHPLLLHHEGIEKNSGQQSGEKIIPHDANGTMIVS